MNRKILFSTEDRSQAGVDRVIKWAKENGYTNKEVKIIKGAKSVWAELRETYKQK